MGWCERSFVKADRCTRTRSHEVGGGGKVGEECPDRSGARTGRTATGHPARRPLGRP